MTAPNVNVAKAVRFYWEKAELSNADIKDLFDGTIGATILHRLKREAMQKTIEMGKPTFSTYAVNTEAAFLAWGLDIADLEARYNKLRKLKMLPDAAVKSVLPEDEAHGA